MLALIAATFVEATVAGDSLEEAASEGKLHYEVIMREAKMPKYGDCYQNALEDLHNGCSNLDDEGRIGETPASAHEGRRWVAWSGRLLLRDTNSALERTHLPHSV
ncbi:hypothetical protein C7M84_007707 [Penaeus vannamei]|uniref:Uncharacterized protein n=1 Tax=Penaeus vannamei TaxID=6689 RepID=A0A3R7M5Y4_PENVA|nr:hypothetical protein C7M84_007707 [Penaeus vannamei]